MLKIFFLQFFPKKVFLGLCIILLSFSNMTLAEIHQQIVVDFDPQQGIGEPGEDRDSDAITGPPDQINRALNAAISGPGYSASGSVGRFGNYGIQGTQSINAHSMQTQVVIANDDIVNFTGIPQRIKANFIIDGGEFVLAAAPGATLKYDLNLFIDDSPTSGADFLFPDRSVFRSFGTLSGELDQSTTFVSGGDDIEAVFDGVHSVEIPVSLQSVDLGVLNPGQRIGLQYQMDVTTSVPQFVEFLSFQFSDPLSVDGVGASPTIEFSAVPIPAAGLLFMPALAALLVCFKRQSR